MKNNIIRVQKNKDNPFVVLNKQCANDCALTWAAKGLHTYLLSLPDDWTIYVSELTKHTSAGRDHTYTVVRELIKNGYMQRFEYRCDGKVVGSSYVVYETKIDIDTTKLTKTMATIVKVKLGEDGEYCPIDNNGETIENSTTKPIPESTDLVTTDSVNTKLLSNNSTKKEFKLKNKEVDVVASHEQKVIDLYKSFKIEKKVMPQTTNLLKQYVEYFSLEVFEYIFLQASENSVAKKYNYIKKLLETFFDDKVFTDEALDQYNKKFADSKQPKQDKSSNKKNIKAKKVKTIFHNIPNKTDKYTELELENILIENQEGKFKINVAENNIDGVMQNLYMAAVHENKWDELSSVTQQNVIDYAKKNNLFLPNILSKNA